MPNENFKVNPDQAKKAGKYFSVRFWLFFGLIIILAGLITYFYGQADIANQEQSGPENGGSAEKTADFSYDFNLVKTAFAENQPVSDPIVLSLKNTKPALGELANLEAFRKAGVDLSESRLKALEADGFFLMENDLIKDQEGGTDDFADTYANFSGNDNMHYRQPHEALYISSDVALHLYHLLIDRSFQRIEEQKFQPSLKAMSKALFIDSINKYEAAKTREEKGTYARLSVFYLIPLVILDAPAAADSGLKPSDFETYAQFLEAEQKAIEDAAQTDLVFSLDKKSYAGIDLDDDIYGLAKAELELIAAARSVAPSPLFTPYRTYFENDYTQFKPRSHYTKNNILKSYFIAMMWYGRMGFSLDSPDLTRDALAITGQVNTLVAGEEKIADIYNTLSAAIEFFVGEVDDLTPYEYSAMAKKVYGASLDEKELNDSAMLDQFIHAAIAELPRPRIVSEAVDLFDDGGERDELLKQLMQFRFMGQRFTPDAYVLNNLTQGVGAPDPETGQNLPSMTTALMPVQIISDGNDVVKNYIDRWVIANAPDSGLIIDKKLRELKQEFSQYPPDVWTQNIYWSWLNTYRSLLGGYGNSYPYFMTTASWQKKNLGTVLGSYTELKHDTLLYAKQSYAERGGGGDNPAEIPSVPLGYVEADHVFWSRLFALSVMTSKGLTTRGLMPEEFLPRFNRFNEYADFYKEIAKKELAGEEISEEEFEKIRKSGHVFKELSGPLPGEDLMLKDRRAGIIADIHTDAVGGEILYEATGKPYIIYVAVKDKNGARLARGLVFSHYELSGPLGERYADEDWQAIVYEGEGVLPEGDEWSRDLLR